MHWNVLCSCIMCLSVIPANRNTLYCGQFISRRCVCPSSFSTSSHPVWVILTLMLWLLVLIEVIMVLSLIHVKTTQEGSVVFMSCLSGVVKYPSRLMSRWSLNLSEVCSLELQVTAWAWFLWTAQVVWSSASAAECVRCLKITGDTFNLTFEYRCNPPVLK